MGLTHRHPRIRPMTGLLPDQWTPSASDAAETGPVAFALPGGSKRLSRTFAPHDESRETTPPFPGQS